MQAPQQMAFGGAPREEEEEVWMTSRAVLKKKRLYEKFTLSEIGDMRK